MDYKLKYIKYKSKCEKLEKKIYEYIKKNNIDIKNVYNLINIKKNINNISYDNDDDDDDDTGNNNLFNYNDDNMIDEMYKDLK
jgi:hypothetical protein